MPPTIDKSLIISIPGQGKQLSFVPNLKEEAVILKRAESQGFYYPMMAMKQLKALSTGLSGKHNVFIPNVNDFKANTFQKVVVFVPGIRATVERRSNDTMVITELFLDPNESYMAIESGSKKKPGVYQVSVINSEIETKYKSNGRITPKDERKVVVVDTQYSTPGEAAKAAIKNLEALFGGNAALKCDFDILYSPVGSSLGGMRNYNPLILKQGYGFGGLLADAMEQSIKQKGVEWASEQGGSAVLTQGLHILANKGLSFKDPKHTVSMHMPTTDPNSALAAANRLGMLADKNMAKGNGNIKASVSSLMTNANRAKDKSDPYNWNDYRKDLSNGTMAAATAVGALSLGAGVLVSSPALATAGTIASTAGALQFAYNTVTKRFKRG